MTGGIKSATRTLKKQLAAFPDVSVAVHVTLLKPKTNRVPEPGEQITDCTPTLSVAVARGYETLVSVLIAVDIV